MFMMDMCHFLPVLVALSVFRTVQSQPSYSTDLESALRTELFTDYEVLQRPAETVPVSITLNLLTINSLDIKAQKLSTTGYFNMVWTDTRLTWQGNWNYSNIQNLFSSETYMWRPAIIIENSVNKLAVISDTKTLIRMISTGAAVWSPGDIYETYCEADITYYPSIYRHARMKVNLKKTEIMVFRNGRPLRNYEQWRFNDNIIKENGEWELIDTSTASETSTRETESYSRLYFTLKLRRRPLFHILHTMFPVILLASLIVFVFKLPPESGERVGMSLTVLLAYAVYLTLISDNIPQTSISASILSTYLTIILMLSALSVVFTIFVLDLYFNHEDDEEMPPWIQKVTRCFLVKIAMWKDHKCCSRRKDKKVRPESDVVTVMTSSGIDMADEKDHIKNRNTSSTGNQLKLKREKTEVSESSTEEDTEKYYSWKEVALILDRCFMYTFIFLVLAVTFICLVILFNQYVQYS